VKLAALAAFRNVFRGKENGSKVFKKFKVQTGLPPGIAQAFR
jgi:hypothetical protein